MKRKITFIIMVLGMISSVVFFNGCAATEALASKSGAQLWGENCIRCHNAPDPSDYSDAQWEVIGAHMKLRAVTLSDDEVNKIVEFLKSAN